MSAKFLKRGTSMVAYEVKHAGDSIAVIATNPCVALMIAARIFRINFETEREAA